jgi:hypothetical protein
MRQIASNMTLAILAIIAAGFVIYIWSYFEQL